MGIYLEAINKIIKAQEAIIGPLAYEQARSVRGISIDQNNVIVINEGDGKEILGNVVVQYSQFFGQASIEVCKEAIRDIESKLTTNDLPDILK